jgi:ATP-dependent helicase/nuclease subunit B
LVAEAACKELAPVPLLAMLKHPLAAVDRPLVEHLERAALRGLRPGPGMEGLRNALKPEEAVAIEPLLAQIETALAPLIAVAGDGKTGLTGWLTAHVQAAEATRRGSALG